MSDTLDGALQLLKDSGLPTEGVADHFDDGYVVIQRDGRVVAMAGMEIYGPDALLRSVAVDAAHRNQGLGHAVVDERLAWATAKGLKDVYLLTNTAADFFEDYGFESIDRGDAPPELQQAPEFASICGSDAIAMRLSLDGSDTSHTAQNSPEGEGMSHAGKFKTQGPASDLTLPERRRRQSQIGTMRAFKAEHAKDRTLIERIADHMTTIASSPIFLLAHAAWFAFWILANTNVLPFRPFDPYPFGLLTMIVSLEAIFLSIFVLMAQGRESHIAELREELALQVNLRMEQEVTKTLQLVAGLYTRLGHRMGEDPELRDMLEPLKPEEMERELMLQIQEAMKKPNNH